MNTSPDILFRNTLMILIGHLDEICHGLNQAQDQEIRVTTIRNFKNKLIEDSSKFEEREGVIVDRLKLLRKTLTLSGPTNYGEAILDLAISNSTSRAQLAIKQMLLILSIPVKESIPSLFADLSSLKKLDIKDVMELAINRIDGRGLSPLGQNCLTYAPEKLMMIINEIDAKSKSLNVSGRITHLGEIYKELYKRLEVENSIIRNEMTEISKDPTETADPSQVMRKKIELVKNQKYQELRDGYNQLSLKIGMYLLRCHEVTDSAKKELKKVKDLEGVVFLLSELDERSRYITSIQESVRDLDIIVTKGFEIVKYNTDKLLHAKFERNKENELANMTALGKVS